MWCDAVKCGVVRYKVESKRDERRIIKMMKMEIGKKYENKSRQEVEN
jgi:hypothetical protein